MNTIKTDCFINLFRIKFNRQRKELIHQHKEINDPYERMFYLHKEMIDKRREISHQRNLIRKSHFRFKLNSFQKIISLF